MCNAGRLHVNKHTASGEKLVKGDFNTANLLGGPKVEHYHQALALVVAETFEQARAAALSPTSGSSLRSVKLSPTSTSAAPTMIMRFRATRVASAVWA